MGTMQSEGVSEAERTDHINASLEQTDYGQISGLYRHLYVHTSLPLLALYFKLSSYDFYFKLPAIACFSQQKYVIKSFKYRL